MYSRLNQTRRAFQVLLGEVILGSVAMLFIWDAFPQLFPARAHDTLASFPLTMIALAYIIYQCVRRPARMELIKAIMLAVAFLFGQPINCCLQCASRRSSTTLPLRSLSSMCFWSWLAGQRHRLTSPLLKPMRGHVRK